MNTDWEKRFEKEIVPFLDDTNYGLKLIKSFITHEKESSRKEGLEESLALMDGNFDAQETIKSL